MGADRAAWLDRLESERDNLRSSLSWSLSEGADAAAGLRVAGAVAYFWWLRGYVGEGRRWLSGVLAATPSDEDVAARAKACHAAGILALAADDCPAAQAFHEVALAIQRQLGDRLGIGRTLTNLGNIAVAQGDYRSARARFEEALTMSRELDDRRGVATDLANLGSLANDLGDHASARAFLEESLTIGREVGGWIVAYALSYLGKLAHDRGDRQVAQTLLQEGLAIARKEGSWFAICASLSGLAGVAQTRGEHDSALALCKEALMIHREVGDRRFAAESLDSLASVVLALAGPRPAARIWGGAERLREEIKATIRPVQRSSYEREVAAARSALHDDAAFDVEWNRGRAMTLEQVMQFALSVGSHSE